MPLIIILMWGNSIFYKCIHTVRKSKLRQELDLGVEDLKYSGKKVSRLDQESSEAEDFDPFEQESDQESSVEEPDSEGEENLQFEDVESGSEDHENGSNADEIEAELADIQKEEKEILNSLSSSTKDDVEKGKHVQNQLVRLYSKPDIKSIWDSLLDSRIRMQKVMEKANQLPSPDAFPLFIQNDPEVREYQKGASLSLCSLLDELISLRRVCKFRCSLHRH